MFFFHKTKNLANFICKVSGILKINLHHEFYFFYFNKNWNQFSVHGTHSEHEWAREGRRIIPLIKRANAITSLTELVNRSKADIQSMNKLLPLPIHTKTVSRRKQAKEPSETDTTPALDDMIVKVGIFSGLK